MPTEIRKIAKNFMKDPFEVKINSEERVNKNIDHLYAVLKRENKTKAISRFVESHQEFYGIVFCRTRMDTQRVADELIALGYNAESLHGDLSQQQRDRVIKKFKNRSVTMLIATDVAARGLDVDDLTHVIHHSLPDDAEYYTHRSGRTARAGKKGISIAFTTQSDLRKIRQYEKTLKINIAETKIPGLEEIREKRLARWVDEFLNTKINSDVTRGLFQEAEELLTLLPKEVLVQKILSKELSKYLNENNEDLNAAHSIQEKMALKNFQGDRFFINIGKKDNLSKEELIDLIVREGGISRKSIGLVDMDRLHSFFEVDKKHSKSLGESFRNKELNGRELRVNRHHTGGGSRSKSNFRSRPAKSHSNSRTHTQRRKRK